MGMAEIVGKMRDAKAAGGGNYIKDGCGRLIVQTIEIKRFAMAGDGFLAEFVVESSRKTTSDVDPDAPGSVVSFIQLYDRHPLTAPGRVKAFLMALTGEPESEFSGDKLLPNLAKITGPDQPLRGAVVDYSTYRKQTKDKSKTLVLPKFTTVQQTPADIATRRKAMDATK